MRVVVYRHQLFLRSETFITEQARHLTRTEPLLLGREEFGRRPPELRALSLTQDLPRGRSRRFWHALSANPSGFLELLRQRGRTPDLIHAHFGPEGVFALPLARALGVPLLTTYHGFDASLTTRALLTSGKPSWLRYALARRRLWQEGDGFVAVSQFVRDRLITQGVQADRIFVRPIGIDLANVDAARDPIEEAPPRCRILAVARHVEKKGLDDLLQAVAALPNDLGERTELVMIGDGPLRPRLEDLAGSLGVASRTRFLGSLPHGDVLRAMHRAQVFCVPSRTASNGDTEGLPMVFLEAAAAGLPIVSTRHSGIVEAVDDGRSGFLVEERRPDQLADRLASLVRDPDAALAMGRRGRALVEQRYDIRRCSARLEDLYKQIVDSAATPRTAVA